MEFWMQRRSVDGDWYDDFGTDDESACLRHAMIMRAQGADVRVVRRTDAVIWDGSNG